MNDWERWLRVRFEHWVTFCHQWLLQHGLRDSSLRIAAHPPADLAHYARACSDIEFKFFHGWGELWGIANRYLLWLGWDSAC